MSPPRLANPRLRARFSLLLPTLVIALSVASIRLTLSQLAWIYRPLIPFAFVLFLAGFLTPLVWSLNRGGAALWLVAGGSALLRLTAQLVSEPILDFRLNMAVVVLFPLFLITFAAHQRQLDASRLAPRLGYGLLLGLALDSAIHGAAGTVNLYWIPGVAPVLVIAAMVALTLAALVLEPTADTAKPTDIGWLKALPMLALGPYLALQAVIFQNQGWVSEVAGLGVSAAFQVVMLGNLLAVIGFSTGLRRRGKTDSFLALSIAISLPLAVIHSDQPGLHLALIVLIGQLAMGWGWALLTTLTTSPGDRRDPIPTSVGISLGTFLFMLFVLLYFATLVLPIPIPRELVLPFASALLGACVLYAAMKVKAPGRARTRGETAFAAVTALALIPLFGWNTPGSSPLAAPEGMPLRVLTYNIRSAYGLEGRQDLERIAQVIEHSQADVVGIQEISRGWLVSGSTDMPSWLSRRLGMQAVFKGTSDPMWGNAILTRFPILDHGWGQLPQGRFQLRRGFLWAVIDIGGPEPLLVVNTHFNHDWEDHATHIEESKTVLNFISGRPFTLLLGDMNAWPGTLETDLIAQAGLIDSWEEARGGEGFTIPPTEPILRIDWIWHTPDLKATTAEVIPTTASDHLPVLATIETAH